ncbi:MAG TPA: D-alanyl-D-alanine carboxypeptidase/D-alanyl-D-alanine-endopeptidase [Gemmatimonadales bacterium]|nr:D-alanyl-D-alanine carboxypeptidase/D-alanyl-D-alanine-endopeptidase [Gemmatimonadales bacterium]
MLGLAALVGGLSVLPAVASAQSDAEVQRALDSWYKRAKRRAPGQWGIAIADQTGRIFWSVAEDQPLLPASTVKLFTTGFARSTLGGNARLATRVVGTGMVEPTTGQWMGTWALEMNGDLSLERATRQGPQLADLAQQLAARGIRHLQGPLVVRSADGPADATFPSVWASRHRGRLFAPPIGAITLHENVVDFTVRPGGKVGARPVIIGESPRGVGQLITNRAKTVAGRRSSLRLSSTTAGGWVLSGNIGRSSRARRLSSVANNPEAVLRAVWGGALRDAGIQWDQSFALSSATVLDSTVVLARVESPTLDSLASEVNTRSLNIGAELLLRWAGGATNAAEKLMAHIRAVTGATSGVHLVDGSGLSSDDRIAPAVFISYLSRFPMTPEGKNFPLLLPANGQGTLGRLGGMPGRGVVRAKTGTLGNVSTLVGYLGRPEGVLVVTLMYNGGWSHTARQEQWRLFRTLGADAVQIPADESPDVEPAQLGGEDEAPPRTLLGLGLN